MFKAIVMEIKENYIIVMDEKGVLVRVKKKNSLKVGETIFCLEEDKYNGEVKLKNNTMKTWLIPLGAVAALLLILINPMSNMFSPNVNNTYAVLTFDVNPSIEFDLDDKGRIVSVKGLNDDGNILDVESIKGLTVEEGAIKLKELLTSENYLGNGNSVLIGFSFVGGDNIQYEEMVQNVVKTTFSETNVAFMKGDEQSLSIAQKQGVSLGKYEAMNMLDEDGIEEAFESLSTQELLDLLKANNSNVFLNAEALDELQDELEDRLEDGEDEDDEKEDEDEEDHDKDEDEGNEDDENDSDDD